MPGSPVANVRRLQSAIHQSSGHPVSSLDLVRALIAQMDESGSLRFSKESLQDYLEKLRNWRIADSVIADAIADKLARPAPASIMLDPPPFHLRGYYQTYVERARHSGLRPLAYATFKTRVAEFPDPSRHLLRAVHG